MPLRAQAGMRGGCASSLERRYTLSHASDGCGGGGALRTLRGTTRRIEHTPFFITISLSPFLLVCRGYNGSFSLPDFSPLGIEKKGAYFVRIKEIKLSEGRNTSSQKKRREYATVTVEYGG